MRGESVKSLLSEAPSLETAFGAGSGVLLRARLSLLPWDGVTFSQEPSHLLNKEAKPSPLKESEECLLVQPEGQHPLFCRPFRPLAPCLEAWPHPHPKMQAWAWLPWVLEGETHDPVRCHTPRKLWLRARARVCVVCV